MKYRKNALIEASRFTMEDQHAAGFFCLIHGNIAKSFPVFLDERGPHLRIHTLEGVMRADIGDWIATGVNGECYPIKPDIFAKSYEPVPY